MKPSSFREAANLGGRRKRRVKRTIIIGHSSSVLLFAVGALCGLLLVVSAQSNVGANLASKMDAARKSSSSSDDQQMLASTEAIQSVARAAASSAGTRRAGNPPGPLSNNALQQPNAEASISKPKVQTNQQDMETSAGHHYGKSHGGHGKYYMYAESPKKGAYKAGFKRGNHKHLIERKEWQHGKHAGGYMKWHGKKGKGSHKWEYKHYDKKHKGHHHHY